MNKELIKYISRGRGAGVPDDRLRDILLGAGWFAEEVDEAMAEAGSHLPIINSVPTPADSSVEWSKGHERVFAATLIIIGLVVGGAIGVAAYKAYVNNKDPERVADGALAKLAETTSFNYKGLLNIDAVYEATVSGDSTSSVKLPEVMVDSGAATEVTFSGSVSAPLGERPKLLLSSQISRVGQDRGVFNASIETKLIDDELFLYITQIDPLPSLDLRSLSGFWLSVVPADTVWLGLDSIVTAPSANQALAWRSGLSKTQAIRLVYRVGESQIEGVDVVEYSFVADAGYVDLLINRLARWLGYNDLPANISVANDQGVVGGQIWLGANDDLPYKIVVKSDFVGVVEGDFSLDLSLSDYGNGGEIKKPENYKPILGLFQEIIKATSSLPAKP